jgi:hypothetical protein
MSKIAVLNQFLTDKRVEKLLGFKVEITSARRLGWHPYGLRSEHGGVYFTGSYRKVTKAAEAILKEAGINEKI